MVKKIHYCQICERKVEGVILAEIVDKLICEHCGNFLMDNVVYMAS